MTHSDSGDYTYDKPTPAQRSDVAAVHMAQDLAGADLRTSTQRVFAQLDGHEARLKHVELLLHKLLNQTTAGSPPSWKNLPDPEDGA